MDSSLPLAGIPIRVRVRVRISPKRLWFQAFCPTCVDALHCTASRYILSNGRSSVTADSTRSLLSLLQRYFLSSPMNPFGRVVIWDYLLVWMVFTPLPILLLIKDELYAISWRGYEVRRIWENWCDHLDAIFKIFLEAGSDPNSKDENGDTPLHMAARSSFSVGLCILRRDGRADFMAKNNSRQSPPPWRDWYDKYFKWRKHGGATKSLNWLQLGKQWC